MSSASRCDGARARGLAVLSARDVKAEELAEIRDIVERMQREAAKNGTDG